MPKPFIKHKLLLDENVYPRQAYPKLNHDFDVKHVAYDLHNAGIGDPEVYNLATALGRIVITANGRHFRPLVGQDKVGVIDVPADWPPIKVDTKLVALLKRHGASYFSGQYRTLATEQP